MDEHDQYHKVKNQTKKITPEVEHSEEQNMGEPSKKMDDKTSSPFQKETSTDDTENSPDSSASKMANSGWESSETTESTLATSMQIPPLTEDNVKDLITQETLPLKDTIKNISELQKQIIEQLNSMKQDIHQLKSVKNQTFDLFYPWLFNKNHGVFVVPEKYNPILIIFTDYDDSEQEMIQPLIEKIKEKNLFLAAVPDPFEDRFLCTPHILFSNLSPIPEFDNAFFFESIFTQFILHKTLEFKNLLIITFKRSGFENISIISKYTPYFNDIIEKIKDALTDKDKKNESVIIQEMEGNLSTNIQKLSRIFDRMQTNPEIKVELQYLEIQLKSSKRISKLDKSEIDFLIQSLGKIFSLKEFQFQYELK